MPSFFKKIFISYTTRSLVINRKTLLKVNSIFSKYGNVYIDLLHNDNLTDPQGEVISQLNKADLLIVIKTKDIEKSEWVKFEIDKSKSRKIEIKTIELDDILNENFTL
ncbi:hypothetical protein [Myroides odoratus]|uniref:hypothetical protein n=1 Tax=Myroides odoratus TaxID=256 RepID=UPI003340FFB8